MGWTGIPGFYGGTKEKIEEVTRGFTNTEVLKVRKVGSTIYSAMHNKDTDEVWCLVTLTAMDKGEFLYKSMSDKCGPGVVDCPVSILDLLTETDNEYANQWREKARKVAEVKSRKVKSGDIIKMAHPLSFAGGNYSFDTFVFRGWYTFDAVDRFGKLHGVRLPKDWKTRYEWGPGEFPSVQSRAEARQEVLKEMGYDTPFEDIIAQIEREDMAKAA